MELEVNNEKLLSETREAVLSELGSLHDLSYELANTVANIYLKFRHWVNSGPPTTLPIDQWRGAIDDFSRQMVEYEKIRDIVANIRIVRKKGVRPYAVQRLEEFAVAVLKYRIDNAENMSPMRLKLERFLNRHKVQEIPNLVDILNLRQADIPRSKDQFTGINSTNN